MTLAELEAQREALLVALSAPDSVTFGDRSMRHRSPEQIRTALQQVDAEIARMTPADTATIETLDDTFEPGALEALLKTFEGDYRELLDWWRRRLNATIFKRAQFPVDIAAARSPQALLDVPRVVVGTIHSVKGGEADVVYLFPDLSGEGDAAYQQAGAPRDSVIRQFYVGMTRARETLYICQQESGMAVRI